MFGSCAYKVGRDTFLVAAVASWVGTHWNREAWRSENSSEKKKAFLACCWCLRSAVGLLKREGSLFSWCSVPVRYWWTVRDARYLLHQWAPNRMFWLGRNSFVTGRSESAIAWTILCAAKIKLENFPFCHCSKMPASHCMTTNQCASFGSQQRVFSVIENKCAAEHKFCQGEKFCQREQLKPRHLVF